MTYAPVCIPTLNRYEHLRKCLESLSRCTWADQTEVYVALDYPPSDKWDKYAPGWEKNRDWLRSIGDFGFKKLHLIERTENYGIWLPGQKGNFKCLLEEYILPHYDRYICSEDDNVFAPCFLEYMNKGLELFKDDEKVYSIGGYKFYYPIKFDDNTYIRQTVDYSPWGVGLWINKVKEKPKLNYKWYRQQFSLKKIIELIGQYGWGALAGWIRHCIKYHQPEKEIDNYIWTYMQLTGKQQIIPTTTLVHNIGLDGSGETMQDAMGQRWCSEELNPLSTEGHFDFIGTGCEYFNENRRIYVQGKYWMTNYQYIRRIMKGICKLIYNGLLAR